MSAAEKQQLLDELQARRKATTTKASQTAPQTPSYRCFLGLEVSPSIREALWRESLQIRQQVPNNHWRWIPPENYHLTLAFLGDVSLDGIEQLQKSLTCKRWFTQDLTIQLVSVEGFPNSDRSRYLVATAKPSAGLITLHHNLQARLTLEQLPTEQRSLRPHITLARSRPREKPTPIPAYPLTYEFSINRLTLFRSETGTEGSRYSSLAAFE